MTPSEPTGCVCVVGAGPIGLGWANLFASAGVATVLIVRRSASADDVLRRLGATFDNLLAAGALNAADADAAQARVEVTSDADSLYTCRWVQESATEDLRAKRDLFAFLDEAAPPTAIIASSTSSIPMTQIAEGLPGRQRCIVVHPMNPPHLLPLVEVVPGRDTAPFVTEAALEQMRALGRSPILCNREVPGFVLNRLQYALVREAFRLLRDGVASVEDIDACISEGLGRRWSYIGPFAVEEVNGESLRDLLTRYRGFLSDMFDLAGAPFAGPTAEDVELAVRGFERSTRAIEHDGLVAARDRWLVSVDQLRRDFDKPQDTTDEGHAS